MSEDLVAALEELALREGARLIGVCEPADLEANQPDIERILPEARSVVVAAVPHSRSALRSLDLHMAQFDTIHSYAAAGSVSHALARLLEERGYSSVAVPAFIPLDMAAPNKGMRGAVDWRAAAVAAGLGFYGKSGLLVTPRYGPAVRLGGLLTLAELPARAPRMESQCGSCTRCLAACPAEALADGQPIDKRKCGNHLFQGGYRAWTRFLEDLLSASDSEREEILAGQTSRELWQNFMSGNYYYCFSCQAVCPVGDRST